MSKAKLVRTALRETHPPKQIVIPCYSLHTIHNNFKTKLGYFLGAPTFTARDDDNFEKDITEFIKNAKVNNHFDEIQFKQTTFHKRVVDYLRSKQIVSHDVVLFKYHGCYQSFHLGLISTISAYLCCKFNCPMELPMILLMIEFFIGGLVICDSKNRIFAQQSRELKVEYEIKKKLSE